MFPASYGRSSSQAFQGPRSYAAPPVSTTYMAAPPPAMYPGVRIQSRPPVYDAEMSMKHEGIGSDRLPLTRKILLLVGLGTLAAIIALPVSDSILLMTDFNYRFWNGDALPTAVIILLCGVLIIYAVVVGSMEERPRTSSVVTVVSTFCTLLGAILVLASLFLFYRHQFVNDSLMYNCNGSSMTQDARQQYLGLLTLRQTPACAKKWSIQECSGFQSATSPRYADYFRALEVNFHCSGFCQRPTTKTSALPPSLFSKSASKTTCDAAAARNLSFMTVGISHVWWWLSISLIGLSAAVGMSEWMCLRKGM